MATTITPPPSGESTRASSGKPIRRTGWNGPAPLRFYRSAVGKKWVMGITGVMLMGFVLVHLIGNIKLFLSKEEINLYGEALRDIPGHLLPRTWLLWAFRIGLITAFVLHLQATYGLTMINRRARPDRYRSNRDYIAADWASRTMRWTGIIVLLFIIFHLADLTWGPANPEFVRGDPYNNLVYSLQRPGIALLYTVAMIALGFHLWHGGWSLFQSLGINNPRINKARRWFAIGFAVFIAVGNLSFPIAVQAHWVELECPHTIPTTQPCNS